MATRTPIRSSPGMTTAASSAPRATAQERPAAPAYVSQSTSLKGTSQSISMSWRCLLDMAEQHCSMFIACRGWTLCLIIS